MSAEGQVLDVLKRVYEADKPQALAIIQAAEGGIEAFLRTAIENAHAGGIAGLVVSEFKAAVIADLDAYVAAHGPEVVYDWIDALLADEAAKLGG